MLNVDLDIGSMSNYMYDMNVTEREHNVLCQLVVRERYGLELVAGSDGLIRRNTVYVLLGRMEDKGLIEGRDVGAPKGSSGPPRRVYRITGLGERSRAAYEASAAIMAASPGVA